MEAAILFRNIKSLQCYKIHTNFCYVQFDFYDKILSELWKKQNSQLLITSPGVFASSKFALYLLGNTFLFLGYYRDFDNIHFFDNSHRNRFSREFFHHSHLAKYSCLSGQDKCYRNCNGRFNDYVRNSGVHFNHLGSNVCTKLWARTKFAVLPTQARNRSHTGSSFARYI